MEVGGPSFSTSRWRSYCYRCRGSRPGARHMHVAPSQKGSPGSFHPTRSAKESRGETSLPPPHSSPSSPSEMEAYERPESADEYGRRSGCFRDHRRRPFRFTNHVPVIHASALETASDGLVDQPDLRPCSIAWPAASLETLVDPREEVLDHPCSSPLLSSSEPLLRPRPAAARNLFLPVDELDLGSVPDLDVQHVFQDVYAKQNCYFSTTWLPLTPVEPERDEGLAFPLQSCKLHSLLRRELDLERVASPDEALRYGDVAVDSHQRAAGNCCSSLAATFPALVRLHPSVATVLFADPTSFANAMSKLSHRRCLQSPSPTRHLSLGSQLLLST